MVMTLGSLIPMTGTGGGFLLVSFFISVCPGAEQFSQWMPSFPLKLQIGLAKAQCHASCVKNDHSLGHVAGALLPPAQQCT